MRSVFIPQPALTGRIHRVLLAAFFLLEASARACQCPITSLTTEECAKYEIIFKGKVLSVKDCGNKFGEAVFEVEELYKGNATGRFKVLFECDRECASGFNPGEEWIIYSRYKQMENALMDWCSRSRRFFKIPQQDFYTATHGNDYLDELKFLRDNLGLHRLLADNPLRSEERNIKPGGTELVITVICSMLALILFYYLFNRFFR